MVYSVSLADAADQGDAGAAERSALLPLELDPRPLVVEDRAQLGILRGGEIAFRLQDEEVVDRPTSNLLSSAWSRSSAKSRAVAASMRSRIDSIRSAALVT